MDAGALDPAFARARAAAAAAELPDVEASTWYGTPSLRVRGKSLMRVKDADTLVFMCPIEDKEVLMEAAPHIYFETDHYKGWPAVLVRLSEIDDAELRRCLERAWRFRAPKRLTARFDGEAGIGGNRADAGRSRAETRPAEPQIRAGARHRKPLTSP